jgi:hypothetical protein
MAIREKPLPPPISDLATLQQHRPAVALAVPRLIEGRTLEFFFARFAAREDWCLSWTRRVRVLKACRGERRGRGRTKGGKEGDLGREEKKE